MPVGTPVDVSSWPNSAVVDIRPERQLSEVLRTKGGFRQWIAAPKSPRVISNGSVQNHERWMGSNPGQEASPMRFSGRAAGSDGGVEFLQLL